MNSKGSCVCCSEGEKNMTSVKKKHAFWKGCGNFVSKNLNEKGGVGLQSKKR